ncbi:uncharacterized protein LOC133839310 isoform X2 [Drosophila sulfurigaster albostrigata]|uniref:uncharacterized protein LOC133839310 isoform X2 n=1 Tax=Drosophila sulfurigaster albostrigata TaxID=89887 RepID=UPI002D218847|nr:uncharacterized protein LOC133839310 isoform X2 [Drosophila sulfurigaster albostrigata]
MSLSLVIFIMFISSVIETAPLNRTDIKNELIEILSKSNLSRPEFQVAENKDPQETISLNSLEGETDVAEIPSKSNLRRFEDSLVDDLQVAEAKPIKQELSTKKADRANDDKSHKARSDDYLTPGPVFGNKDHIELTLPLPRYETDKMGNWVHNPWAVSFGDLFRDTRYNIGGEFTVYRMRIDSRPHINYYKEMGPLSTVCIGRSTPYNIPPVTGWLFPYFYTKIRDRKIMMELRKTIFKDGRAIECHSSKYPEFRSYIDCALLRNMRLEFLIPEYPKHQLIPDQYTEIV